MYKFINSFVSFCFFFKKKIIYIICYEYLKLKKPQPTITFKLFKFIIKIDFIFKKHKKICYCLEKKKKEIICFNSEITTSN